MPMLNDGSCAPSHIATATSKSRGASTLGYLENNVALHTGFVVDVHYPGDPGYENARSVLYDIMGMIIAPGGGLTWMPFYNARWGVGMFGASQDYTRARLNVPKGWNKGKAFTEEMLNQSSYVAFICANGRSQNPIIIGLLEHPSLFADDPELGHYWAQAFNGVETVINGSGEYSITFTGAILDPETNAYIEPPEATTGTTLVFDKEGSILLDNVKGESIKLDKKAESLDVAARAMTVDVTDKDYATTVKGKVTFLSQGNAVFDGKKVYIGKEGSDQPLVLGKKLVSAMNELINALSGPLIGQLGAAPVSIHPTVKAALLQWQGKYAGPGSAFLSRKAFVE